MALTWAQNISDGVKISDEVITEIRNNINIERVRRGIASYNFVQIITHNSKIYKSVIEELYNAIQGISSCSIMTPGNMNDNSLIQSYKNQLDTFNANPGTPIYQWVWTAYQFNTSYGSRFVDRNSRYNRTTFGGIRH